MTPQLKAILAENQAHLEHFSVLYQSNPSDSELEQKNKAYDDVLSRLEQCPFTDVDAKYFQSLSTDSRLHVLSVNNLPVAYWDVTPQAQAIFGDIVTFAKQPIAITSMLDVPQLHHEITKCPNRSTNEDINLGSSSAPLEITFTNGRTVTAWVSEDGSICPKK